MSHDVASAAPSPPRLLPTLSALHLIVPLSAMSLVFALSSLRSVDVGGAPFPISDKIIHGVVYFFVFASWFPFGRKCAPIDWVPRALVASAVFAATDEIHQAFVPGRAPELLDLLSDVIGASVGAALVWLHWWGRGRRRILR